MSVEIDPPRGASSPAFEQVKRIVASGSVDAIDVNSGSMARVGMDALVLSGALEAEGIETVPHLTTRDSNLDRLASLAVGCLVSGRRPQRARDHGDPPSLGDHPETSGVYELDSIGLVEVLSRLNRGTDWAGKVLGGATNFTIGAAAQPSGRRSEVEIERYHAKVEAGVHFLMTQPILILSTGTHFEKRIDGKICRAGDRWNLAACQLQTGVRLNNEVPGIVDSGSGA